MQFIERTTHQASVNIDEAAGVLKHVKLNGPKSRNGRRYTLAALREAVPLYVGKKVFVNHPRSNERGDDRQFESWVGIIEDAELRSDGIYGTIRLFKESPFFPRIIEAARVASDAFGCSHVCDGEYSIDRATGLETVTSISEIRSVDLVTDPATTKGLWESTFNDGVRNPLAIIADAVDQFAVDALMQVSLAYHKNDATPLAELAAELRVLAAEYRRRSPPDQTGILRSLGELVFHIENVLLDPVQTGAISILEPHLAELTALVNGPSDPMPVDDADGYGREVEVFS